MHRITKVMIDGALGLFATHVLLHAAPASEFAQGVKYCTMEISMKLSRTHGDWWLSIWDWWLRTEVSHRTHTLKESSDLARAPTAVGLTGQNFLRRNYFLFLRGHKGVFWWRCCQFRDYGVFHHLATFWVTMRTQSQAKHPYGRSI